MININRRGVKDINTGRNVENVANTLIQTGPTDTLLTPDGYIQPATNGSGSGSNRRGDDCGCDTSSTLSQLTSGLKVPGSNNPNNFRTNDRGELADSREPTPLSETGSILWERLFCRNNRGGGGISNTRVDLFSSALFLRNLGCTAQEIARRLGISNKTINVDRRVLQDRVFASLGSSASTMSRSDREKIVRRLEQTEGVDKDRFRLTINGESKTIDGDQYEALTSTANLTQAVTSDQVLIDVLDNEVEYAIADTLFENALAQGVPNAIDLIEGQVSDPKYARRLYLNRARQAALMSDLYTLRRIIELTDRYSVLQRTPTLVNDVLMSYRMPKGSTSNDRTILRQELLQTLVAIHPDWDIENRLTVPHRRLSLLYNASKDTLSLLSMADDWQISSLIRRSYPTVSKNVLIQRQHRRLALRT